MFTNRKRCVVLFAFAAAAAAIGACSSDVTAPAVPLKPLQKQPLKLDTAALCPYGWMVVNGVVVCDETR